MDILNNYETLLFLIVGFLLLVVIVPFIIGEIRKIKRSKELKNRIIKIDSLTDEDLKKIKTENPEGKKLYPAINHAICVGCATCIMSCQNKKALYLVGNKSTLVNPFECTGRGDCEKQCPTGALQLVEYGKKLKIRLPEIDENFQSNINGIYIIGSLNGSGLIKEAINQGRAVISDIMKDVFPDNLPKILIAGAGPGGISAFLSARKFWIKCRMSGKR